MVLNVLFCRKKYFLQKGTFRTTANLVLNVLFCRRVCFLQKWTFRTRSAVVLNVHFCRKLTLLQKRTFGTTAGLVLNVHFCRIETLLQKRTFMPPYFFLNFANLSDFFCKSGQSGSAVVLGPQLIWSSMSTFAEGKLFCKRGHLGPFIFF